MERAKDLSDDMVVLRVACVLLVALLLAIPTVAAGSAEGELTSESLRVIGKTDLTSSRVSWAFPEGVELGGDARALHVERLVDERTTVPVLGGVEGNGGTREKTDHGESTFVFERIDAESRIAILADAPTQIDGSGAVVRSITSALVFGDPNTDARSCDASLACAESLGGYELELALASADLTGPFTVLAHGYSLTVVEAGTTTTYRSGEHATGTPGGLQMEDATLILRVESGSAAVASPSISRIYVDALRIQVDGRLIAEDARGTLRMDGRSYRATGDLLQIDGTPELRMEPRPQPGPLDPRYTLDEPVVHAASFGMDVRGELVAINLAAVPVYEEESVQVTAIGLVLASFLGFVAYFWPILQFHATSIALPLYTRLAPPSLLDNEVRNNIYSIVREHPGISARAAHRLSDQSWGTVVYHLRQLEAHHLVVSRRHGRARNYYENHGKYKGMERQLACLRSERARLLARHVIDAPGLTQETLAQAANLAQPTTSYYIRKLVQATLVAEERDGRYVRYVPGLDLARFLQASEPAPPAEAAATAQA